MRKIVMKIKNNSFAISTEAPAIPTKPNSPAMIAITRKNTAQLNITLLL